MFVLIVPTIISAISSFYNVDCDLISCEKPTEEEKEENKSEKDIDDLEEYILNQGEYYSEYKNSFFSYSFSGKHFIDIVSDVITPPPEFG